MVFYIYEWLFSAKCWCEVGYTYNGELAKEFVKSLKIRYPNDFFQIKCHFLFEE